MKIMQFVALLCLFLLSGCASNPPISLDERSPTPMISPESVDMVSSAASTSSESVNETISEPDFYAENVSYDHESDGLFDWTLPRSIADRIREDGSCEALKTEERDHSTIYLPVRSDTPMRCEVLDYKANTIVLAVGFGETFEGADYPQSMILVLRDDDVMVYWNLVDFPLYDEDLQNATIAFERDYPDVSLWPPKDPIARAFYNDREAFVQSSIETPSSDVTEAISFLRSFLGTLTL